MKVECGPELYLIRSQRHTMEHRAKDTEVSSVATDVSLRTTTGDVGESSVGTNYWRVSKSASVIPTKSH